MEDPNYVAKLQTRWGALRGGSLSDAAIFSRITTYTNELTISGAVETNFTAWSVLGVYVWPNNFVGNTYAEELGYLNSWLEDRLQWLDIEIENL